MPIFASSPSEGALRQGEILSNVIEPRIDLGSIQEPGDMELDERLHPFAVILTQDCDLDWDYKARREQNGKVVEIQDDKKKAELANKLIPNVLLCEVWFATELKGAQGIASDLWRKITSNQNERYHVLKAIPADADSLGTGFPEFVIDFKRVFTVPTDELYWRLTTETRRRSCLTGLFMQDLSTRFACYLLRVALPDAAPPKRDDSGATPVGNATAHPEQPIPAPVAGS